MNEEEIKEILSKIAVFWDNDSVCLILDNVQKWHHKDGTYYNMGQRIHDHRKINKIQNTNHLHKQE